MMPIGLNESLTFVQAPYIQNLVTAESCTDFVKQQLFWNKALMIISVVAIAYTFYMQYKMGKFNKEKEMLKNG